MAKSRSLGLALLLSSAALVIALRSPRPRPPVTGGPLDEAVLRAWAARSDWSRPPQPGEAVEWRGERWQVVAAGADSLRARTLDLNDRADRVVPLGEARLIGMARAMPSGEVVRYRLHAVWGAD